MVRYFTAVLVICCILGVEYLLHIYCYKAATWQKLREAEYCSCSFSAGFTPVISYLIVVLIISSIASAEYMLHMQCCKVAKMQHLIAAEYTVAQCSTE